MLLKCYPSRLFSYHPIQPTFLNYLNREFRDFVKSLKNKVQVMSLEEVQKEFETRLITQKLTITFNEIFSPVELTHKTYTDPHMPLRHYDVEIIYRQYKYSYTGNQHFLYQSAIHHPYAWGEPMPKAYIYKDYLLFQFEGDNHHPQIEQLIARQLKEVDTKLKACIEAQNKDIDEYIQNKNPEIAIYYKKTQQLNKILEYLF